VFGNTKLLQVYKDNIYLGDEENAKIFRLKYRPDIKVKVKTKIEVYDKFEKFSTYDFKLETSSQSNSSFTYKILLGESISINNTGTVKMLKPGKTVVKISQVENDIYEATSKTITINILSNAATISKISPISKKVDDAEFKLSPTSNSNGAFSFKIKTGDAVSVDATGTVKIVKAGTATMQIDQAAGKDSFGNNLDASSITVDIVVNKLNQTISYNSPPKSIFNDNKGEVLVATSSSGLAVIYKVISGPATIINGNALKPTGNPGKVVIEISQVGNEKYSEATVLKIEVEIKAAPVLANEDIVFEPNAILYPNPTNSVLNIYNGSKFESYTIIDGTGKIYKSGQLKNKNLINVEDLTDGLYIVELFGGKTEKSLNFKLLIRR
jgi:Secretion system C-terminal sorting domain